MAGANAPARNHMAITGNDTIRIGVEDYQLLFNLAAIEEIRKRFGSLEAMSKRFTEGQANPFDMLDDVVFLIAMMVNQGIHAHNYEIRRGLRQGANRQVVQAEDVKLLLLPRQIAGLQDVLMRVMTEQSAVDVGEDVDADEDVVLKEIQNQKNA
jgi:hypothetical protein